MHGTLRVCQVSREEHDVYGTLSILTKYIMKIKVKSDSNTQYKEIFS
jgi:hypothetical protein